MSGKSTRNRQRQKLSRAERKAYESRRAEERKRISATSGELATHTVATPTGEQTVEYTSYSMSRDEEFAVIKADLIRLAVIVAVLVVMLGVATIVLR